MKAKEVRPGRAHTGAEPIKRSGEIVTCQKQSNDTTSGAALQDKVLSLLHTGAGHAVTLAYLCRVTGADGRRVREAITRARLDGVPVISDEHGYYYPGDLSEKRRFVRSMRGRAREILRVARAVESS